MKAAYLHIPPPLTCVLLNSVACMLTTLAGIQNDSDHPPSVMVGSLHESLPFLQEPLLLPFSPVLTFYRIIIL